RRSLRARARTLAARAAPVGRLRHCTVTVPVNRCTEQKNGNVPACVNLKQPSPLVMNLPSAVPLVPDATGWVGVVLKRMTSLTWTDGFIGENAKVVPLSTTVTVAAGVTLPQLTDCTDDGVESIVPLLLLPHAPRATIDANTRAMASFMVSSVCQ